MVYNSVIRLLKASLVLLILFSINSYSKNKADFLVVASENHVLQYQENGINKGPTIGILSAVLKEGQLTADVRFMPWARALEIAKTTPNVLILSIIRTTEREPQFHWVGVVSELARVFINLADKPENKVFTDQQAKHKVIGVIRGSAAYSDLISRGFIDGENLYLMSGMHQLFNLFSNGRVDLIYADPNSIENYLASHAKNHIKIDYQKIELKHQRVSYIAASKGTDAELLMRLKAAMEKFQQTSLYSRLKG
jgi:polar amino acid transport system substrate-binding protein